MKLSDMKRVLAEGGLQLTKSLGQNFLHDANQLRRIGAAAGLQPGDRVLEIGPGLGPLTELLLQQAGTVLAIEMDQRLVQFLQHRFRDQPGLTLVHADALQYLRAEPRDWTGWKMVSNLPYSVASPLLVDLAQAAAGPGIMVATLQREVARRIAARAGDADYGVLSLLIQLHYEPRSQFRIPPTCFFPQPEVDSACLTLTRRATPLLPRDRITAFAAIVKRSFSQRRKMMLKLLRQDWEESRLEAAFAALSLPSQTRAETVSLEQFVRLTERLSSPSGAG